MRKQYYFYFVSSLLSLAHGSNSSSPSSRHLVTRWLEEYGNMCSKSSPSSMAADSDWSCLRLSNDKDACNSNDNENRCVWCAVGPDVGVCVSSSQGDTVNAFWFPHLTCGDRDIDELDSSSTTTTIIEEEEDFAFWDAQMTCSLSSNTQQDCNTANEGACTWCIVHDPPFAMCTSEVFMRTLELLQPPDEPIRISQVIHCPHDEEEQKEMEEDDTPGLMDISCYLAGALTRQSADGCTQAADAQGINCVAMSTPMTGWMCLTNTQATVLSWLLDVMDDMGVDPGMDGDEESETDEEFDEFVQHMEDIENEEDMEEKETSPIEPNSEEEDEDDEGSSRGLR